VSKKISKKTVANLETGDCRWPIGDPRHEDFHFCGAQQVVGRPYCTEHCAQSYEAAKARLPSGSHVSFVRRAA
jgi:GcrA cell cycle regulator